MKKKNRELLTESNIFKLFCDARNIFFAAISSLASMTHLPKEVAVNIGEYIRPSNMVEIMCAPAIVSAFVPAACHQAHVPATPLGTMLCISQSAYADDWVDKLIAALFEEEALELHAKDLATKLLSAGDK